MDKKQHRPWALILGGSSGLGLETARKLARHSFNIIIIHRDRKIDLEHITSYFQEITLNNGVDLFSFNSDATNGAKQLQLANEIAARIGTAKIKVLVHSIAKGNLKPMLSTTKALQNQDFNLTIDAMATSFYDWVKLLVKNDIIDTDFRAIAFTSEGSTKAWANYAAVSAAKAALEAIMRSIALEFAPIGIKANCIQAGVTETKSFAMIPGSEALKAAALVRNPNGRLTTAEDVANAVYLLTTDEAKWITGTVIKVDGGESLR